MSLSVIFLAWLPFLTWSQAYDFEHPCETHSLPDSLYEVSGITYFDRQHLGCVQDEKGVIFVYNFKERRVESTFDFYGDGDYEGIAKSGNDVYVLRSDGMLFHIRDYFSQPTLSDSVYTYIPIGDNEGLCFDDQRNLLLIAAKGRPRMDPEGKNLRFVFSFDPKTSQVVDSLEMILNLTDIAALLKKKDLQLPLRVKKNGEPKPGKLKFMPSAIAIHPATREYYMLSAADRLLLILDTTGKPKDVFILPEALFPKPEGLIFLPSGDLFISNEGRGGTATVMRFCPGKISKNRQ